MNELERFIVEDPINKLPQCPNTPFANGYHRGKKAELCDRLSACKFSAEVVTAVESKIEDLEITGYFLYLTFLVTKARLHRRNADRTRQARSRKPDAPADIAVHDLLERLNKNVCSPCLLLLLLM